MSNYVVSDTSLGSVANAIRGRTGESGQLVFPDGFNTAINGMIGLDLLDGHLVDSVASCPIASFPDGADNRPVRSLVVGIEPVQDLHGQSNPYPPGGGKNLLNVDATAPTVTGLTIVFNSDGTVTVSGTVSANTWIPLTNDGLTLENNISYMLSGCPSNGSSTTYQLDLRAGNNADSGYYDSKSYYDYGTGKSVTGVGSKAYPGIFVRKNANLSNLLFKPMVCLSSASNPTDFAPYSNICPISGWTGCEVFDEAEYDPSATPKLSVTFPNPPGTIYGGTVEINKDGSGTLTADTAIYIFDGINNAVNAMSDMGAYKFFSKTNLVVPAPNTTVSNDPPTLWCDTFKAKSGGGLGTAYISGGYFRICADSSFESVEAFNTWLQSNNVTFIYKLNTPIVTPISPGQVQSLLGQNHVWADTGNVAVEYSADPFLFAQKVLSE